MILFRSMTIVGIHDDYSLHSSFRARLPRSRELLRRAHLPGPASEYEQSSDGADSASGP